MSAPQSVRARVRAELTKEIFEAARQELATEGAPGLSLRAVARRLGMAPSALYRYFPNRNALLTALIIDAYEQLGAAAAAADTGRDPARRWRSVARAVRAWAAEHPHEWALLYGSPVPGYEAPRDTVPAALLMMRVLAGIVADAHRPGTDPRPKTALPPAPAGLRAVLAPLEADLLPGRPPEVVAGAVMAWTELVGMVSLERFGHYTGATTGFDPVFDYAMAATASVIGLGSRPAS